MKGYMSNDNGEIVIENEVIAQYAGHAALGCFGIVGMASISMKDGIAKLLKGDSVSKGVNVVIDEGNNLSIDFHIIVAYGVCISTVCDNLISTVKYSIEEMTNMNIKAINIFVEGVRVID
ncbi:MAG: Asp23/Gls24 family envelope stress response protein [Lachnospiraceae bacterium]|nr:Asp23/Gls24 family envelope stress response protein [Lachnospiraceae bacterium]